MADEQLRFPLGELRRRFKRDDGATCASIKVSAGFNWFHPSLDPHVAKTIPSWSLEPMPYCPCHMRIEGRMKPIGPPERCHHFGELEGTT